MFMYLSYKEVQMLILLSINIVNLEICLTSESAWCILILEQSIMSSWMVLVDALKYFIYPKISIAMIFMLVKVFLSSIEFRKKILSTFVSPIKLIMEIDSTISKIIIIRLNIFYIYVLILYRGTNVNIIFYNFR
jgi:hypothetical protein